MKSSIKNRTRVSNSALACANMFAILALSAAPALAQDAKTSGGSDEASDANTTQEIIVTAQFREQKLQDTPLAITAVDSALLEARGQTDIAQIAGQAPNVTLRPQQQSNGIGLIAFIRGIGQTDFNYALEPGVGIYVDDIYIPTLSSSLLDLMDLERIEVLRGPQGTLAGKNSIGGAIKLFSKRPDGSGRGSFAVTYGSFNRIDARGVADLKIADNLFARISGATKNQDGYVTLLDYGVTHPSSNVLANTSIGDGGRAGTLGGKSYAAGKLALRWLPTPDIEVNLSGDYTHERNDAGAQVLLYASNAATTPDGIPFLAGKNGAAVPYDCAFVPYGANSCDTTPAGYDPRFINYGNFLDARTPTSQAPYKPFSAPNRQVFDGWGVMGNVTAQIADKTELVWISSYRKYHSAWGEEQDGSPVPISTLYQTLRHHAWSQELRLNGSLGKGLFDYTLGGFYFDQNGSLNARVDLNYAGIDFIHGPDTTPSTSKALFFNGTLHPTDAWSINGGIRQSWDKKTYTYFRSNPDGTVPGPLPCEFFLGAPTAGPTGIGNSPNCLLVGLYGVEGRFKGKRTDWRIETDYRFSPEFFVYGSIATGYKGGGVNPRPFFGPSAGECSDLPAGVIAPCNQIKSFKPETLTTYEMGFKSDLFGRGLRVNGAVFFNKYDNIILTLTQCPGAPCLQPANVGKADVWGFELETTAHPVDGLSLDGSLSYLHFRYKDTGTSGVPLTDVTPYTPEWNYSFGIQYDWEMKAGTIGARFDGSYQSTMYTDAFNGPTNRIDGRFLGNARLSYTTSDKDWMISLEVQNLFDKYYYQTVEDAAAAFGTITASPGMPRTWAVTVKREF
ncbi:iron complex outermembrane recepter protein [Novosphingobium sp. CF614]|uniref:TonB-dependent receptor n=1 Tax=Novosphingobium sp. CF614 TaxID=1884364 RepID=UPI0008E63983|nr:TonB-dependent receptor [Novosphingobium sp. CF614]SFF89823.1 iron complex outermembrane recepter protein [Novosphingobium sp. CF614]